MAPRTAQALLVVVASVSTAAPSTQTQEPRFRGGTNLVRLDVYATRDGVAVADLGAEDFEVFEDNTLQTITSFGLVQPRGPAPDSARVEPQTVAESLVRAQQPGTRLFVLFLDTLHTHIEGSFHAQSPIAALLDRVVGRDDLVGVMTPEIAARGVTFSPRTSSVGRLLRDHWTWGERQSVTPSDPRENEIEGCYPDDGQTAGFAAAMIRRRRELTTMRALEDLVGHLEGLREERSFVLLLTEGWLASDPDPSLARAWTLPGGQRVTPGGPDEIVAIDGRMVLAERAGVRGLESCERERSMLAAADLRQGFEQLMRHANRANVSFYPIDPRGLVVFDTDLGPGRIMSPAADAVSLSTRLGTLRRMAQETDGDVVLNTNLATAGPRLLADVGAYYLLGYVSTNQKLDGRYRKLTVRLKRPGVSLRARPGYLAPSIADLTAAPVPASSAPSVSLAVTRALTSLPAANRIPALHVSAAATLDAVHVTIEVDRATAATPEWSKGGSVRVEIGPMDGAGPRAVETAVLAPGARVAALRHRAEGRLSPGRYQVRVQATPDSTRGPLGVTVEATIPDEDALLGGSALAQRRGPYTGRLVQATADPRFRRTERLVVETPILAPGVTIQARLLNARGQAMPVPVAVTERTDGASRTRFGVAELSLAPLAPGEYVVEMTATRAAATALVGYALRIVP